MLGLSHNKLEVIFFTFKECQKWTNLFICCKQFKKSKWRPCFHPPVSPTFAIVRWLALILTDCSLSRPAKGGGPPAGGNSSRGRGWGGIKNTDKRKGFLSLSPAFHKRCWCYLHIEYVKSPLSWFIDKKDWSNECGCWQDRETTTTILINYRGRKQSIREKQTFLKRTVKTIVTNLTHKENITLRMLKIWFSFKLVDWFQPELLLLKIRLKYQIIK